MSYNIDGKIANQQTDINMSGKSKCSKCNKLIPKPNPTIVNDTLNTNQVFNCSSYIGTKFFIYESKKGTAVVYCSEYCRNKHNHRFQKLKYKT